MLQERLTLKARQGVQRFFLQEVDVTMTKVPNDNGQTYVGGNTVTSGYLKDVKATEKAFRGGWFHSGDIAARHSNGYTEEVKDRLKDIIISGRKNVSSVSILLIQSDIKLLDKRPKPKWGEIMKNI